MQVKSIEEGQVVLGIWELQLVNSHEKLFNRLKSVRLGAARWSKIVSKILSIFVLTRNDFTEEIEENR